MKSQSQIEKEFDEKDSNLWDLPVTNEILEDIKSFIAQLRKDDLLWFIKEYGHYNDGCGCCSDKSMSKNLENLLQSLNK